MGKFGGLGPFPDSVKATGIVHPDAVLDLLVESQTMPRYFFTFLDDKSAPGALKVLHTIQSRPGLPESQIAVCTAVHGRASESPRSRIMIFEPTKCPMPVRIEIWRGSSRRIAWDIQWTEFIAATGDKVWFPKRVRQEEYWTLKDKNHGKVYLIGTAILDTNRSRVNQLVADGDLSFTFPVDTIVTDEIAAQRYTVTEEGQHGELHLTKLYQKLYISPKNTNGWTTLTAVAIALLLLIVLLCCVRYSRHAKRRRQSKA